MTTQSVQVKLELGHRATFRSKPTPQGFTHDWCVFVRGPGNESNIYHFIDKVVFHLHESFHKPRRVIKEYPFQVAEAGYAGFLIPIEVYFKNKEEPKKVIFQYDLFLHLEGQPPVNHIRCEKLTFNNPTEDFRRKLIKAGGVGILGDEGSPGHTADKPAELSTYKPHSSSSMQYKLKQESDEKYSSSSSSTPASGKLSKPIKEHSDVKPAWKEPKAASKGPKSASKEPKSASKEPKSASKEPKSTSKEPKSASKEPKSTSKEPKSTSGKSAKEPKSGSKDDKKSSTKESKSTSKVSQKPSGKRPPSSSPPPSSGSSSSQDGTKKRKKSTSTKEKTSSKQSSSEKSSDKQSSGKGKSKSSKSKTTAKQKKETSDDLFAPEIVVDRRKSATKSNKKEPPKVLPPFDAELSTEEKEEDMDMPSPGSPSSSISFSSLPRGGGKGALNTLMHEIDENDDDFDDQDIVTPFQTDYRNNHTVSTSNVDRDYDSSSSRSSSIEREKEKEKDKGRGKGDTKGKTKEKSSNKKASTTKETKKNTKTERKSRNSESSSKSQTKPQSQSNQTDYLNELVLLHRRLSSLKSREQIQRVVDLIGDTEHFQISNSSFDFDLCTLDKTTVRKIQECVAASLH